MVKEGGAWKAIDWDRRAHAASASGSAKRGAAAAPRTPCSSTSTRRAASRASSTRGSPASACGRTSASTSRPTAPSIEANRARLRRRVASALASRTRGSSSRSAPTSSTAGACRVPQQLDFADARAKIEGAPRFVYIGPRRSLTGLNADQWIACTPGTELAIANALAGRGTLADGGATRAASPRRRCTRLQQELAAAQAGARARRARAVADALDARAGRRRAQPGRRRRRHDDPARRGDAPASTAPRASADVLAAVERMRARPGAGRLRARREPGVLAADGGASSPRRSRRCRSRSASRSYPGRDDGAVRSDPPGSALARVVGRRAGRSRHRRRCSSRRWIRCSRTRARRRDVLIQVAQKDPANAARYPQARLSQLADRRASPAARRRSPPRSRRASARARVAPRTRAGAGAVVAAQRRAADRRDARRLLSSSPIRRRCSATDAARTSRGCRSCPIPSPRSAGARGSRSIRRRRHASASSAATSSR